MHGAGVLRASRSVPTAVVVAVTSEDRRPSATAVAAKLRARGIPTEVAPEAAKFGREGAGLLTSLTESDAFAELPEEVTAVAPGDIVRVLPFSAAF